MLFSRFYPFSIYIYKNYVHVHVYVYVYIYIGLYGQWWLAGIAKMQGE
jgi:hypothetical protein